MKNQVAIYARLSQGPPGHAVSVPVQIKECQQSNH
jgi:hypothetical protein